MRSITSWGLYPVVEADVRSYGDEAELRSLLDGAQPVIARGLGRSYGDSSLGPRMLSSHRHNRFLAFDPVHGELTCEGGVSLADILHTFAPRGWFLPVTPGTKFVTVGGAIAADVHGKNHHGAGNFGHHVTRMSILTASGEVVECSPTLHSELFETTCGGMGLTGIILRATIRLIPIESAGIREEIAPCSNLEQVMSAFDQSDRWTYSVAWIDCLARGRSLGRSILMLGEHASASESRARWPDRDPLAFTPKQKAQVPFPLPGFLLNPFSVRAFNSFYHASQSRKAGTHIVDYDTFFYPLDAIAHWNRMYGRRGFTQYQVVFPMATSRVGLQEMLEVISASGQGSFLAVLKKFGPQSHYIAFPMEGYTLALDFPLTRDSEALFRKLDEITLRHGGRLYLAKDVRMSPRMFFEGYRDASAFRERLRTWDPQGRWGSRQSKRLEITR